MLYDRRHTHWIKEFGGLATPMPVLAALYLFMCFLRRGCQCSMLCRRIPDSAGTFQKHAAWAAWRLWALFFRSVFAVVLPTRLFRQHYAG